MVEKTQLTGPDYKKIYFDLVSQNFPHRMGELDAYFFMKRPLNQSDVMAVNKILYGNNEHTFNSKLRVYSKDDILRILNLQKKLNLNNSEMSKQFKMSRNTISKWKKLQLSDCTMNY